MANLLLVVADKTLPTQGEGWMRDTFLPAHGHTGTYISDEDPEPDPALYDGAIISDSVTSSNLSGRYLWTKGIIVGWGCWLTQHLGATQNSASATQLAIYDSSGPTTVGLTSPVTVFSSAQNVGYTGTIGNGAIAGFKLTTSLNYVVYSYETGAVLTDSSLAPGRRVAMGLKNASWQSMTADGQTIWLNAINFVTTSPNNAPVVTITSPSADLTVPAGTKIVLEFAANDPEDGDITSSATVTSSNTDDGAGGSLGTGSPLTIDTTGWADGARTITVTAPDSGTPALSGSDDFVLTVGAAATGGFDKGRFIVRAMGGIV